MPNGGIFKQTFDDFLALIFESIVSKRVLGTHPPFPLFAPGENSYSRSFHFAPLCDLCGLAVNPGQGRTWIEEDLNAM